MTTPESGRHPESSDPAGPAGTPLGRRVLVTASVGGLYLALSVAIWWNVWSSHPTSTTTCGCGDSSLFTWFLAWPAYAISHGLNPLWSSAMFHPGGVNLLSNTAEVGPGVVLAPVTWLFGPVATLNVALTLSPALSALTMFVLLRRWVAWTPAAFVGGLLYGFSPFILISLTDSHLMLGMAFIPPLMVACLDELIRRRRQPPLRTGIILGLLITVQFFIGTEVLVLVGFGIGLGLILVVLDVLVRRRAVLATVKRVATGVGAAVATAGVLLAYPAWFAFAGPAHLSGAIWPSAPISFGGTILKEYVTPVPANTALALTDRSLGGYQGAPFADQYLGWGLVAVLVVGWVLWRRDRRLWLFGLVGLASIPLSTGLHKHGWTPWRLFVYLPMMENIIPSRFLILTYLAAAAMLAIIVDHTHTAVLGWRTGGDPDTASPQTQPQPQPQRRAGRPTGRRWWAAGAGVGVAALALVPLLTYVAGELPFTATAVTLPRWFTAVAPRLPGHQVVLAFPVAYAERQSAMTWQAVDGMHYAMAGGGGPGGVVQRAGDVARGQTVIGQASFSFVGQTLHDGDIEAVRQALRQWGVTIVVIPDQHGLPNYEQINSAPHAVALMTAATGRAPVRQADAWVWNDVEADGPPLAVSVAQVQACANGVPVTDDSALPRVASCVLAAASGPDVAATS